MSSDRDGRPRAAGHARASRGASPAPFDLAVARWMLEHGGSAPLPAVATAEELRRWLCDVASGDERPREVRS